MYAHDGACDRLAPDYTLFTVGNNSFLFDFKVDSAVFLQITNTFDEGLYEYTKTGRVAGKEFKSFDRSFDSKSEATGTKHH